MADGKHGVSSGHVEPIPAFDPPAKPKRNKYALACSFLASMTSILLGYDIGVMTGAVIYVHDTIRITEVRDEVITGSLNLFSLLGAAAAGRTADWIGRRYTVVLAGVIFCAGAFLMGLATDFAFLMAGRFVAGIGVGYALMIAPVYTAEVAPASSRGFLTSFPEVFINFGRLITDNIILGYETLHWIRSRKGGKQNYATLKLDMSKAYDRVEWSFIEKLMNKLGFSTSWIEKVMRCVRTVRYSFSINGELTETVIPERGVRQGDPLSPYLFVLCAQGLSSMLLSYEARNIFQGVKIANSCPSISHLFFADDSLVFFKATVENCAGLRRCLALYEKASGQMINFDKSALSFSPNTAEDVVCRIKRMLSIRVVQGHELYLGLPTFSTRQKKMQFRYLIERIVERIQGWGSKFYSNGGKEILIKAVLQAIPSYAMSCFRIPKSILEAIEKECSNFWWGNVEGRKKMHWKTWHFLCKPKSSGGLGFWQLDAFKKALLAKQIWRIMTNPDSLVARVLKSRYFKHQDIMSATIGNNPSFIWRSMIWSRNLLTKGISWRVGNGKKIQTFSDIWIPGVREPLHDLRDQEHFKSVNKLIQQGSWNESAVRQTFPSYIAEEVLNIPLAGEPTEDVRYWRQDLKGCYSVRDGYKTEIGCYEPPPNCSEIHSRSWWKFLWALSIPPKIRIFWWRTLHNIIPTEVNLLNHHVPVIGHCRLCNYGRDTTEHALFWCPRTKACWKGTLFKTMLKRALSSNIVDIFLWMKEQLNRQDFECFAVHTWAVWIERQKILHNEDRNLNSISTDWSSHMLHEYRETRKATNVATSHSPYGAQTRWKNPEMNQLRLETDAAYNEKTNRYSVGGAIRNHAGQILLAFGQQLKKPPSVVYAEIEAMRKGLSQAKEHSIVLQEITSDSLLGVQAVTSLDEDLSYTSVIAQEVRKLMTSFEGIRVNHVRRSANVVAHSIAFFAISSPTPFVWELGNFPIWLVDLVTKDMTIS